MDKIPQTLQRERARKLRPAITRAIIELERKYGETAVASAYNRHREIRRTKQNLQQAAREARAKIAQLKR